MTSTRFRAAGSALFYWFHDVANPHFIREVFASLAAGRGRGTQDNITIWFHHNFADWEPERGLFRPGQFLITAQWPQVNLPDHSDLHYPITHQYFCDCFREHLEKHYININYHQRDEIRGLLDDLQQTLDQKYS
jgi:cyclopropane fatty-acyl-phospholipid synthase-like methyltransferase